MEHTPFIGLGHNPEGPDLPTGLGMRLAGDPKAMDAFGRMSSEQKSAMIGYVQGAATGEDAKHRLDHALQQLHNNQIEF